VLLGRCRNILREKYRVTGRQISDKKILETAMMLYYAYLTGLIPQDIVENAIEQLKKDEVIKNDCELD
jgi:hypothetical protein